jgi:hypothetical protein
MAIPIRGGKPVEVLTIRSIGRMIRGTTIATAALLWDNIII